MLKRKTPDTLATILTINGQGEQIKMAITYFNRTQDEIQNCLDTNNATEQAKSDMQYANRQAVLFVVKEMASEYELTDDGLKEMEADRPGMIEALFYGFHKARRVELVKN